MAGGVVTRAAQVVGSLPVTTLTDALGAPLWLTNNANFLAGNAAAIFNLSADSLASGTVPDARLSPNVALLNGNQTFTGQNTFRNAGDFLRAIGGRRGCGQPRRRGPKRRAQRRYDSIRESHELRPGERRLRQDRQT